MFLETTISGIKDRRLSQEVRQRLKDLIYEEEFIGYKPTAGMCTGDPKFYESIRKRKEREEDGTDEELCDEGQRVNGPRRSNHA